MFKGNKNKIYVTAKMVFTFTCNDFMSLKIIRWKFNSCCSNTHIQFNEISQKIIVWTVTICKLRVYSQSTVL